MTESEVGLHFFLGRYGSECYTVVVEDTVEDALYGLSGWFDDVKYLKSESLDCKDRTKYKGNRKLNGGIIRGCWFTCLFSTKRSKPPVDEKDMDDRLVA